MDSWTVALGILEAIAVIVGLFVLCVLAVWSFIAVVYILAMLDEGRKRLWSACKGQSVFRILTWPIRALAFLLFLSEDAP